MAKSKNKVDFEGEEVLPAFPPQPKPPLTRYEMYEMEMQEKRARIMKGDYTEQDLADYYSMYGEG